MDPAVLSTADTESLRAALVELECVAKELERRRKERGIDYFIPNAPQLRVLRSNARIMAYCGGNRAGKSHVGAAWLSAHLTHQYPSCVCHGQWLSEAHRYSGVLKAVIVVTEFAKIESVIEPKLMSLLPKAWIRDIKRTPQGYIRRIIGHDGSLIDVLSGEQDPMAFEGQDWDLAWIDEPTSYGRFVAIQRGLTDRQGLMLLTFTPLVEPWMKERLVDRTDGKDIEVVEADTYANLEDIHGHPIQTKEAIQFLERMMTEEERQTRIHGQFFHLRGVVYKEFLPGVHSRDFAYQYPDPIIAVLDPHTRKPHWVIWAWINRMDQIFVDRELIFEGTLRDLGKAIISTEQQAGYKVCLRLIDPNFGRTPMIVTGRTVIEELARPPFPVRFTEANDDKEAGILKIKQLLHFDRQQPLTLTNMPGLYLHQARAASTIRQLRNYQFDEWKAKTRFERDPKEDTKKKEDDGADCVRYLCMHNPNFDRLMHRDARELEEALY